MSRLPLNSGGLPARRWRCQQSGAPARETCQKWLFHYRLETWPAFCFVLVTANFNRRALSIRNWAFFRTGLALDWAFDFCKGVDEARPVREAWSLARFSRMRILRRANCSWLAHDERRNGRASAGEMRPLSSAPTTAGLSVALLASLHLLFRR